MKRLLRLYPPGWRSRYGSEVADLLEELPVDARAALDLVAGAVREWWRALSRPLVSILQAAGGPPMLIRPFERHPTALALLAIALVGPTLVFICVSLLAYGIGVPGMATTVDPIIAELTAPRWVNLVLVCAPAASLVVAALPLIGIGFGRAEDELRLTVAFRARLANLVAIAICLVLGGILASYLVADFLFEAP